MPPKILLIHEQCTMYVNVLQFLVRTLTLEGPDIRLKLLEIGLFVALYYVTKESRKKKFLLCRKKLKEKN